MSYSYQTWLDAYSNELVIPETDPNFLQIIPSAIDYAEQKMYRELDLLTTVVRDSSGTLAANSRNFTLPQSLGRFVVTNGINVYTPVATTITRNQLVPISRDFMDVAWPSEAAPTTPSVPQNYAMITDQSIIVGPAPDAPYIAEVIGTIRPTPLSPTNTTTYLTLYLPDLWFAATMIFGTGYKQNWGAQSDDPGSAVSWQSQYDKLFASANVEEQRKRYAAGAWGSMSPTPIATPSR